MKKVMIIGINGMLGHILAKKASESYQVIGTYQNFLSRRNYETVQLDITDVNSVNSVISKFKPDLIVNCAAITDLDFCETHADLVKKVHVDGTRNLSEAAKKIGAKFIHVSTDFVFDGKKGNYTEEDLPNPLNVYAQTKYAGEKVVSGNLLIIRTSIYGWNIKNKHSIVEWIIDNLKNNKSIYPFIDSFFTPIYTGFLAKIILRMFEKDLRGLFHVSGSERVSKYDFALEVAKIFNLNNNLIKKGNIDSFKRIAKRPKDTSLNCEKIKKLRFKLITVDEGLEMMKNDKL